MIKILMGQKGTGKTKVFIDWVNEAVSKESGNVVCINKDNRLMYSLNNSVRLIDTQQFDMKDFNTFYGFLCGIIAQNFDITHIFVDSVLKIVPATVEDVSAFLKNLEILSEQFNLSFTLTISEDVNKATDDIKKYLYSL